MTSSVLEKHLLIEIQLFQSKAVLVLNVSAKFEEDQIEDEEAAPILTFRIPRRGGGSSRPPQRFFLNNF